MRRSPAVNNQAPKPFTHGLAIYDGSARSREALDFVCRIVRPHKARLTILHVKLVPLTEPLRTYREGDDPATDALVSEAERFAEERGVQAAWAVRYARTLSGAVISETRVRGVDLVALAIPDFADPEAPRTTEILNILDKVNCAVMLCRPSRQE